MTWQCEFDFEHGWQPTIPEHVVEQLQQGALVNQKRYNKDKVRQSYALAAPTPRIAAGLLLGHAYNTNPFELIKAAHAFMLCEIGGEQFVAAIREIAEGMTGFRGGALYQRVAEYGEKKYDRGNFLLGAPVSQYLDSWIRHVQKLADGETTDEESGELHIAHVVWNTVEAARWVGHATRDDRLKVV